MMIDTHKARRLRHILASMILTFGLLSGLSGRSASGQDDRSALEARKKVTSEMTELLQQAIKLELEGKYDDAIGVVERYLAMGEKALGAEDFSVAMAHINLARLYNYKEQYERAEFFNQRAA